MTSGYSFRPRLWAVALAAAACAAGIALGNWQAGRAEEKRALAANVQRIVVMGEFLPERTVFLDNKVHAHRPGYEVVTPLRLAEGIHVLVNRGWVAAPPTRDQLPEVQTPRGRIRVEGVVQPHLQRAMKMGEAPKGPVRQNLELKDFAAETGLTLQAFVIQQHSDTRDGLARDWPPADAGAQKNEAYSFQWYSLAGLALVLGIVFSLRKREPPPQ